MTTLPAPRIVIAPAAFRGTLAAHEAAGAMAAGARDALPGAAVETLPMADGGDGTLDVLAPALGASLAAVTVRDPFGRPLRARYGWVEADRLAIVEMAEASGLRVARPGSDPWHAATWGTGDLIRAALDRGARTILVGAGGSATTEMGAGALSALGAKFLDADGGELEPTPAGLERVQRVDLADLDRRLAGTDLRVLCDVQTPLSGSIATFGPQKGVAPGEAHRFAAVFDRLVRLADGRVTADSPMLAAGGGLAGALVAFAGARALGGAAAVADLIRLPEALEGADVALTGEGAFDRTSLAAKAPYHVAMLAHARRVGVGLIAGAVDWDAAARLPAEIVVRPLDGPQASGAKLAVRRASAEVVAGLVGTRPP